MSELPKYWNQLSTLDFASIDPLRAVAVLPLAATEQHGPHLPLSVDQDIVQAIIEEGLKHLSPSEPVLVLPTLSAGLSTEHCAFAGTLSFSAQTMLKMMQELGCSVARAGIRKLLLFNAHGGNVGLMDVLARELRGKFDMLVFSSSWYQLEMGDQAWSDFSAHELRYGVHAGDVETSLMLRIAPHKVKMQYAQNFPSASEERSKRFTYLGDGKSAKLGWHIQDYNPSGAVGDASCASAEKGEKLLLHAGKSLGQMLRELILIEPLIKEA